MLVYSEKRGRSLLKDRDSSLNDSQKNTNMILNNQHWIDFFQGYVVRVELETSLCYLYFQCCAILVKAREFLPRTEYVGPRSVFLTDTQSPGTPSVVIYLDDDSYEKFMVQNWMIALGPKLGLGCNF